MLITLYNDIYFSESVKFDIKQFMFYIYKYTYKFGL